MSSISSENPSEGLSQFYDLIWGEVEGFVYLPTLDRKNNDWKKTFFKWPEHKKNIIQHTLSRAAQGLDVYYSPVIYKGDSNGGPGRPVKDNVLGSNVLWAEFDGASEDYSRLVSTEGGSEASEGVHGAHSVVPVPSVRVQSSLDGHEHVYWRLDEFVKDIKWLEDKNRSITYSFRSDTSGWDAVQILRPPYTHNHKRDRPVTVIRQDGPKYGNSLFEPLVPPPQIVTENIVIDDLPSVESVIAKYPWDEEHFKMFTDPHIEEGKRSAALMRMGYFCIEAGMSDTEAYAILYNADQRWGKYKGRNDQKRRLVDIIDRARQKHPNPTAGLTFAGLLGQQNIEEGRSLTYGFKDFLESDIKVEWAIEGLLEVNGYGMIASMAGVGKTQVSIGLGIDAVLGRDFLKWKMPKKHKIVLFSLEMGHVGLKIFLEQIAKSLTPEEIAQLQDNFIVVPIGESIALEKPEGLKFLESILDEVRPTGIIFDSIAKLSVDELNEKTARLLNDKFSYLRSKYNAFMWFIHHNRKASDGNKKPTELSDVYGNQYLTTDMSAVIILWPHPSGVEVIHVKERYAEKKPTFVAARSEYLTYSILPDSEAMALSERLANDKSSSNGHNGNSGNGSANFSL